MPAFFNSVPLSSMFSLNTLSPTLLFPCFSHFSLSSAFPHPTFPWEGLTTRPSLSPTSLPSRAVETWLGTTPAAPTARTGSLPSPCKQDRDFSRARWHSLPVPFPHPSPVPIGKCSGDIALLLSRAHGSAGVTHPGYRESRGRAGFLQAGKRGFRLQDGSSPWGVGGRLGSGEGADSESKQSPADLGHPHRSC